MGLNKVLIRGLIALCLIVGVTAVAPARAITYIGKWDPPFGAAFPDLGWRGEGTFVIPDACLAQSGLVMNSDSCSASGMQILSAEVEFYSLSAPTNPAFQETLLFNIPSQAVASMTLNNGLLTGVSGTFPYARSSTLPLAGGPYTSFVLYFVGDLAQMSYVSDAPTGLTSGVGDPTVMTFSVVPEPGSVPLVLTALLVIGLLAWRRTSARALR